MTEPGHAPGTQSASGTSIRVIPFGKYLLLERLGIGGMAEVFVAKPLGGKEFADLVAIKRIVPALASDPRFIQMFVDEASIAGHLRHANIVTLYEVGKLGDSHYMALEHVSGKDTHQLLERLHHEGHSIPAEMVAFLAFKLCDALDYAHNKRSREGTPLNLVHRDVSPQNILLSYDGQVKLADFGIAKAALRATRTQPGMLKGKLGYMSPEQACGFPIDYRSDLFALGTCMYEWLTGSHPFAGSTDVETRDNVRHLHVQPPSVSTGGIPLDLDHIVVKALAKRPDDRWQSASDMQAALQRFLEDRRRRPFGARQLASWVQTAFAHEMSQERSRLAVYRSIGTDTRTPPAHRASRSQRGASKPALDAYTVELPGDVGTDDHDESFRSNTGEPPGDRTAVSGPPSFDDDRDPTHPEAGPPAAMTADERNIAAEDSDAPETIYFRADPAGASTRPPAQDLAPGRAPAGDASPAAPATAETAPEPPTEAPESAPLQPGLASTTEDAPGAPPGQRGVPTMELQAMDVRQVAEAAAAAEPSASSAETSVPGAPRGRRRARRGALAGGLAAIVVLTGLTAWHVAKGGRGGMNRSPATQASGGETPQSPAHDTTARAPAAKGTHGRGILVINSKPWAEVYIDGRKTDKMTPVRHLEVSAGRHTIGLETPDGRMQEWSIEVAAGETVRMIKDLDSDN